MLAKLLHPFMPVLLAVGECQAVVKQDNQSVCADAEGSQRYGASEGGDRGPGAEGGRQRGALCRRRSRGS